MHFLTWIFSSSLQQMTNTHNRFYSKDEETEKTLKNEILDPLSDPQWFLPKFSNLSRGLSSEENINFFFDPIFVVGSIGIWASLVNQATQISQLINEVE